VILGGKARAFDVDKETHGFADKWSGPWGRASWRRLVELVTFRDG
jgi:hypothetical protein